MDDFKIPDIAAGKVIPPKLANEIYKKEEHRNSQKKQRMHEYFMLLLELILGAAIGNIDRIYHFIITIISSVKQ